MKIIIRMLIFLTISSVITGCTPSESAIQTAIAKTQSVFTPTPQITLTPTPHPLPTNKPTITPSTIVIPSLNFTNSVDNNCEFTITNIYFSKTILPPNTSGIYTYYEVTSSQSTYLDVTMSIKNIGSSIKSTEDFLSIQAIYDGRYNYTGSAILVDDQGNFTLGFYGIEPLLTREVHYLFEVPSEVEYSSNSLKFSINSSNDEYILNFR